MDTFMDIDNDPIQTNDFSCPVYAIPDNAI